MYKVLMKRPVINCSVNI